MIKLSLGPVLYYWTREALLEFYAGIAELRRRHRLPGRSRVLAPAQSAPGRLAGARARPRASGKQVVLSSQALIESESDLKTLRRIAANGDFTVEANEMGAVRLLTGACLSSPGRT